MNKPTRYFHLIGMTLFLGSIFTFIVASSLGSASLPELHFARKLILCGTHFLTLPGLFLTLISGALGIKEMRCDTPRILKLKAALGILIFLNTLFIIYPAVAQATELARLSNEAGQLLDGYKKAYFIESSAGAFNVLAALTLAAIGVRRRNAD